MKQPKTMNPKKPNNEQLDTINSYEFLIKECNNMRTYSKELYHPYETFECLLMSIGEKNINIFFMKSIKKLLSFNVEDFLTWAVFYKEILDNSQWQGSYPKTLRIDKETPSGSVTAYQNISGHLGLIFRNQLHHSPAVIRILKLLFINLDLKQYINIESSDAIL